MHHTFRYMRKYKFVISVVPHVLPNGNILPENTLFSCEVWADKHVDRYEFGENLFNFWKNSSPLGEAQDKWIYDWNIEQL